MNGRPSWVVVPAKDEQVDLPGCLEALHGAAARAPGPVRVLVVDDGSTDWTAQVGRAIFRRWRSMGTTAARLGRTDRVSPSGAVLTGRAEGVGWARRTGIERAIAEATAGQRDRRAARATDPDPRPRALIATTDADSLVDPDWLAALHAHLDAGHEVVAGDVRLEDRCDPRLAEMRAARLGQRLAALPSTERPAPHPHFAGSNLAFSLDALHRLGALPTPVALEDQAILDRCRALGLPVIRVADATVTTSARTVGRAELGLAEALGRDLRTLLPGGPAPA